MGGTYGRHGLIASRGQELPSRHACGGRARVLLLLYVLAKKGVKGAVLPGAFVAIEWPPDEVSSGLGSSRAGGGDGFGIGGEACARTIGTATGALGEIRARGRSSLRKQPRCAAAGRMRPLSGTRWSGRLSSHGNRGL